MKLSEAIRKGQHLATPSRGWFGSVENGERFACAITSAVMAVHGAEWLDGQDHTLFAAPMIEARRLWPEIMKWYSNTADCIEEVIVEWFDTDGRSHDEIADKLESIGL